MAVSMTFYSNFKKKDNSTKVPSGGTSYSVVFKDAFSIIGGTVKLQVSFDTAQNYTAAKYSNKYYKVTDVISTSNGIVEVSLSLDVLATYKADIAGYTGLMERAPDASQADYIPDTTISNTGEIITNKSIWLYQPFSTVNYCFQIRANNDKSVQCYYASPDAFIELLDELNDYIFSNPITNIVEINIVPMSIGIFESLVRSIIEEDPLGSYRAYTTKVVDIGTTNIVLSENTVCAFVTPLRTKMYVDSYNLAGAPFQYNDARKVDNNYTRLSIYTNDIEIPLEPVYNDAKRLIVLHELDIVTLSVRTDISVEKTNSPDPFKIVNISYTNIGIPFYASNNNAEKANFSGALLRSSIHLATLNPVGLMAELGNITQNIPASCTGTGSGTIHSLESLKVRLFLTEFASTDKDPANNGYPYYKVKSISVTGEMGGQTGYYKFANPQIALAAQDEVRNQVNSYMANGFIYE